jgi:hypothetical protein
MYNLGFERGLINLQMSIEVDSDTTDGTLFGLVIPTDMTKSDHALLFLEAGQLSLRFELGSGQGLVRASAAQTVTLLAGSRLVPVRAEILGSLAVLYIAGEEVARGRAGGNNTMLNTRENQHALV